jgi:hypothetical protein
VGPRRVALARAQRWPRVAATVLFLALLTLVQISGPRASVNILWRFAVLSFDNPATQLLDELALEKTPFADALGDVLAFARLATSSSHAAPLPCTQGVVPSEVLSARISRSPPLV